MLKERMAQMAGTWYPADPQELREMVTGFLENSDITYTDGPPHALAVPHAGYIYSGQVAACSYKTITSTKYDTIIVIA
ncbi:MAG: AmmeMemoRadiSam system protein B, partial [Pirellulales bacterium]|nr:AmmeMemoRadiSam system protein B [Pirellulales bacterium]